MMLEHRIRSKGKTIGVFAVFCAVIMLLTSASAAVNPEEIVIDVTTLPYDRTWGVGEGGTVSLRFTNILQNMTIAMVFRNGDASQHTTGLAIEDGTTVFVRQYTPLDNSVDITFQAYAGLSLHVDSVPVGTPIPLDDDCVVKGTTYPGRFNGSALAQEMMYHPMEAQFSFSTEVEHSMELESGAEMSFFSVTDGDISIFDVINDPGLYEPNFPIQLPTGTNAVVVRSLQPSEFVLRLSTEPGNDWQPDLSPDWLGRRNIRLTIADGNSTSPEIAVGENGEVHVVWIDKRNGYRQLFYKRSVDGALTWGLDTPLTGEDVEAWDPAIAAYGQNVFIIYHQRLRGGIWPPPSPSIPLIVSTDGGNTWAEGPLVGGKGRYEMAANDRYLAIAMQPLSPRRMDWDGWTGYDLRASLYKIPELEVLTTTFTGSSFYERQDPTIALWNDSVFVAWECGGIRYHYGEIYFDNVTGDFTVEWESNSWPYPLAASTNPGNLMEGRASALFTGENEVQVIFVDDIGDRTVLRNVSGIKEPGGWTWGAPTLFADGGLNTALSHPRTGLGANGTVHVVWTTTSYNASGEVVGTVVQYKAMAPSGAFLTSDMILPDQPGNSSYADVAVDRNGCAHIVWEDYRHGEGEIYYVNTGSASMNGASLDVSSELAAPTEGEEVTLSATFTNDGDGALINAYANFYVMSEPALIASIPVRYFAPHSTMTFETKWIAAAGYHAMVATIDSDTDLGNGYLAKVEKEFLVNTPPTASTDIYQSFTLTAEMMKGDATITCTLLEDWEPIQTFTLSTDEEQTIVFERHLGRSYALNVSIDAPKKTNVNLKIRLSLGEEKRTIERTYHFSAAGQIDDTILLDEKLDELSKLNPTFTLDATRSMDSDDGIRTFLWEIKERIDEDECEKDCDEKREVIRISLLPIFNYTFTQPGAHAVRLAVADWHGLVDIADATISTLDGGDESPSPEVRDYRSWGIDRTGVAHAVGISEHDDHDRWDVVYANNSALSTEWSEEYILASNGAFPAIHVNRTSGLLYVAWIGIETCKKKVYLTSSSDGVEWKDVMLVGEMPRVSITDLRIEILPEVLRITVTYLTGEIYFDVRIDFDSDGIIDQEDTNPAEFDLFPGEVVSGDAANSTADGSAAVIVDYGVDNDTVPSITEVSPSVPLAGSIGRYYEVEAVGELTAYLRVVYDPSALPAGLTEQYLRMYRYDGTQWQICKSLMTGDDTGVDIASHTVWAKVHSLSTFTAADASILDSDGDGLSDLWETTYGLDPNTYTDTSADPDSDGLNNTVEFYYWSNPQSNDTDGDTLSDGAEALDFWRYSVLALNEKFFSPRSETYMNISQYPVNCSYAIWLNGTARV
ncbi:MAG: hypothetical protein AB1665_08810, partial [Candidatus Thermoplasmatota archaeon]